MAKLVNMTPHEITLFVGEKKIRIPPSGNVIRLAEEQETIGEITVEGEKVPVKRKKLSAAEGKLPPKERGTYYIVSLAVAQAYPDREDFLVVNDTVRDEAGRIVGAKSLARV